MVSYDVQDFGGLEEYAVNLAIGLKQQGQAFSYISAAWVNPDNQYARRLKAIGIPLVQPPKWISELASNWDMKKRLLRGLMLFLSPLTFLMGLELSLLKKRLLNQAWTTTQQTSTLNTTEVTNTLGSLGKIWGRTWNASNFINANFRIRVIDVANSTARDFYLDYIAVHVTYQP